MNQTALIQAQKCAMLLHIVQNELDLLDKLGSPQWNKLKQIAHNYALEQDKTIAKLYANMPKEYQQKHFHKCTNQIEAAINDTLIECLQIELPEMFTIQQTA